MKTTATQTDKAAADHVVRTLRAELDPLARSVFSPARLHPEGKYPELQPRLRDCHWQPYGKGVQIRVEFLNRFQDGRVVPEARVFEGVGDDAEEAARHVRRNIDYYIAESRQRFVEELRHTAAIRLGDADRDMAEWARLTALADGMEGVQGEQPVKTLLEQFDELAEADSAVSAAGAYEIETPERRAEVLLKGQRARDLRANLRRALQRAQAGR